jgi:hypothetical protein
MYLVSTRYGAPGRALKELIEVASGIVLIGRVRFTPRQSTQRGYKLCLKG